MFGYERQNNGADEEQPMVVFHSPFTGAALLQKVREILDAGRTTSQTQRSEKMP